MRELARRGLALLLAVAAAVAGAGYGRWSAAALLLAAGAVWYLLLPRPSVPPGALRHDRLAAVWLPDLIGFLLATTFLSLPFIVSAHESWLGGPWGPMLLTWPLGLAALTIFWIAARHQCWWALLGEEELHVADMGGVTVVRHADIVGATMEAKRLPRWFGPLLVLMGGWRGLAVVLLHGGRARHRLLLKRKGAPALRMPLDALTEAGKLIGALETAGVPLTGDLIRIGKGSRRRRKRDD